MSIKSRSVAISFPFTRLFRKFCSAVHACGIERALRGFEKRMALPDPPPRRHARIDRRFQWLSVGVYHEWVGAIDIDRVGLGRCVDPLPAAQAVPKR